MNKLQIEIENQRKFWAKIARANNWYVEPFFVQVWVNESGDIVDSVSHIGLTEDIVIEE